jgi:hypothetical protein
MLQSSLETSIEEPSTNDKTNDDDDDQQNNTDIDMKDDNEMKDNKVEESDTAMTNISSVPQEDNKEESKNGKLNCHNGGGGCFRLV